MAAPTPQPRGLKIVKGRGEGKDGKQRDQGGRVIPDTPNFRREAPNKPIDLEGYASFAWDLIVAELGRLDILKQVDALALEIACETYAMWKDAVDNRHRLKSLSKTSQGVGVAPWVKIELEAARAFRGWCNEFGITPSAEMKLGGQGANEGEAGANPFIWTESG